MANQRSVNFSFKPGLSTEQMQALLEGLPEGIAGVTSAFFTKKDSTHQGLRRMAYVYVADRADIDYVVRRLDEMPEIEPESVSAPRQIPFRPLPRQRRPE